MPFKNSLKYFTKKHIIRKSIFYKNCSMENKYKLLHLRNSIKFLVKRNIKILCSVKNAE